MPWGDRTGPLGEGPMTGRGFGYCGRYNALGRFSGFGGEWRRCFRGFGRRFRWFWRRPFFEGSSREEEQILRQEAEILRKELEAVQKRLSELEKEK